MVALDLIYRAGIGLLPVLLFLLVLVYMDSYKLIRLRTVVWVIAFGALAAIAGYFINAWLQPALGLGFLGYARYVAPVTEEALKALVVIYLFRTHRIGFLVDSAILGFAVGAGFALVENLYYLQRGTGPSLAVWVIRGFGTAVMHGGTAALFGLLGQVLTERRMRINPLLFLPGFFLAVGFHSLFNHFPGTPILATLGTLVLIPLALLVAFRQGEASMSRWLRKDFDADAELIAQIDSAEFSDSHIGRFLHELREKFDGLMVVDMLCYLRVYTELAIRAKGVLMAREAGLDIPLDDETRNKMQELRYLEQSIGSTGLLVMRPFLLMERKDLWQMSVLQK
ncbi:PrsW family intramembrane metalloprotease [Haliea sp. E17]|uniref:PrsW family intramembrane metalloprotease n=1 Tax=Haliea sp. E17 TaxID=3401576 RepID=UPI003AABB5F4